MSDDIILVLLRVAVPIVAVVAIVQPLITGKLHIRGGKWITTKSMPNNPIIRSETPRDFWFVWGLIAFGFTAFTIVVYVM